MKAVINYRYGGFSISRKAAEFMAARGNTQAQAELEKADTEDEWYGYGVSDNFGPYLRTDPDLIAAVETLGEEASGDSSALKVEEFPDGVAWEIDEHGGRESIRFSIYCQGCRDKDYEIAS